jgi:hypothetical protein
MVVFTCEAHDEWSNTIPCISHASWELLATQLYVSLIVFLFNAFIVKIVGGYWNKLPEIPQWAVTHFGSPGSPPEKVGLNASLRLAQLCSSTTIVILWIFKSYERDASPGVIAIEIICCLVFLFHLFYALVNSGWSMGYALGFEAFLDAFTITPLIMQAAGGSWLTIAFLRVYRMNTAFTRLAGTGVLDDYMGELSIALVQKLVAAIMVIFIIGGTFFIMEGLGDIDHFADRFVDSNMGAISFFQMCYFAFMVMSTVGFGDYSPTTVFSRFFIFFATVGGVIFFSVASADILDLTAKLKSGAGKFRPKKKKGVNGYRGHILVMGGGVSAPTKDACEVFLKSLCRDDSTPEIVLMGTEFSEDLKEMLNEHWASNIVWFKGNPLSEDDLDRVLVADTSMVFYIADFNSSDTFSEDHNNILCASVLQTHHPLLQYRLMTIEVQHLELAAHVGLNMFNVYAIDGMKAAILATALKCPGFPTLVLNLGLPDITPPRPSDPAVSPWLDEYITSAGLEIYGFMPESQYYGKTFKDFAIAMGKQNIAVFALQVNGSLRLNPSESESINEKSVVFAMAADQTALDKVAMNGSASVDKWLPTFGANRREGGVAIADRMRAVLKMDSSSHFATTANNYEDLRRTTSGSAGLSSVRGMNPVIAIGQRRRMKLPTMSAPVEARSRQSSVFQYQQEEDADQDNMPNSELLPPTSLQLIGGHVVLALLFSEDSQASPLFAQVEVIINNLRATTDTPVIIIAPSLPGSLKTQLERIRNVYGEEVAGGEKEDGEKLPNIYFVEGEPFQPKILNRAFVRTAAHFLSLTSSVAPAHSDIADRNNLIGQNVLDIKLKKWKRADLAAVFDWCSPNSFSLMSDAPSPFSKNLADALPELTDVDKAFAVKEPRCHYRYAAGRILPKPLIAGVYSMAYYTPGVLELFEALIDPSKTDQVAKPWPLPVAEKFIGQPYPVLAENLLAGGAVPLGVLRAGGPLPYVLSCTPNEGIVMKTGDAVYVLASTEWAEANTRLAHHHTEHNTAV